MKTIGIREARENLRHVVELAEREEVAILIHRKPKAPILGTRGESLGDIAERAALDEVRARMASPSPDPVPLGKVRERLEAKWRAEADAEQSAKVRRRGRRAK